MTLNTGVNSTNSQYIRSVYIIRTDEICLNPVVGEAAGWKRRGGSTRVDIRPIGVVPLTKGVLKNRIRLSLTTPQLRKVAVVGEVVAEHEQAGPLVFRGRRGAPGINSSNC